MSIEWNKQVSAVSEVSPVKNDYPADNAANASRKANYGKTFGNPKLSEEGQKYYEELKKKYSGFDFVLVSKDKKDFVKANASAFANSMKTVVLIDDEKIERMATDENYRKKYESVLDNAVSGLSNLKEQLEKSGAQVKGYGVQVGDDGRLSFFAVLKESGDAQKARIEKKRAENKEIKKAEAKKAAKEEQEERIKNRSIKHDQVHEKDVTITANSIEELISKVSDYTQNALLNSVQTEEEKMIGQHIDFKG